LKSKDPLEVVDDAPWGKFSALVVSIPGRLDRRDELALFEFGFPLDLGAVVPVEERRDLDDGP
jgi:hypothetical protein